MSADGTARTPVLGLVEDELVACVSCGLCLPHCPTYRVTGRETASPRGRIEAMRAVEAGAPIDDAFVRVVEECVQCRGCEAACPSSVPFGHLVATTRAALTEHPRPFPARRRAWSRLADHAAYRLVLPRHRVLLVLARFVALLTRWPALARRLGLPRLPAGPPRPLDVPVGDRPDVWLFTGCVMDAWCRDTHRATARLLRARGAEPGRPRAGADCCGALHLHAGRRGEAAGLAARVVASMPGDAPVVVDSAGCAAVMAEYGELLGTDEARRFSARVRDPAEWIEENGLPAFRPSASTVVVQDPCHQRHVRGSHGAVHRVLAAAYDVRTTDDDGLCCGAGGAYAMRERGLARSIRRRKVAALRAAGGPVPVVASANPGCLLHLRAAGLDVRHPADLLAERLEDPGA